MKRILVVEDDTALGEGIKMALQSDDAQIELCRTFVSLPEPQEINGFSLVILDINLPDGSGMDYLRKIRSSRISTPVILLTANDIEMNIVAGLEAGADDYITKPFSLAILRARVNAQLRRENSTVSVFEFGRYLFNFDSMEFRTNGLTVELSKTEQKLLRILVENSPRTVARDTLIDRVWTDGAEYVDENALSVTIKRLRDKLDAQKQIRTVYGIGYCWENEK